MDRFSRNVPRRYARRWMVWALMFPVFLLERGSSVVGMAKADTLDMISALDWEAQRGRTDFDRAALGSIILTGIGALIVVGLTVAALWPAVL